MSGIAGWIDWQEDLTCQGSTLTRMADTLRHRGANAQEHWLSPRAALAYRGLHANDSHTGEQSMAYQTDGRTYAIVYNGTLYNLHELQRDLADLGHTFRTSSDTEVLLHAYAEWEAECVQHLNGVFAFGLWDEQKQRLLLARDHLGVKPLYYARRGSALLFASELKALLAHPLVKTEVDAAGLAEVLTFARTPGSGVYRDVHELRPGHLATWDEQGLHLKRYWSLRSAPHTDDLPTTTERIRVLLEDALKRLLIADVPVATLLSGGLDSSLLTALACKQYASTGKTLHTYSLEFADSARDFQRDALHIERDEPWVEVVSAYLGTCHHTITVDASALVESLLAQLYAHDLPMVGQMNTSLYLLFKAMKQQAGVALSGEVADEIFGGYPWFHVEALLNAPTFPWMPAFLGPREDALSWVSAEIMQKVQPVEHIGQCYRQTLAEVPRLEGEDALAARRREMFYLNLTHWLTFLLERKDRMGMANGLEVRVPFGDYRLVEYVWNVPWEMKMADAIEKGIVRRGFTHVLPRDVLYRKKSAYPSVQNPQYDAMLRAWALRILNNPDAAIQPLLNSQIVRSQVEGGGSGRAGMAQVSLFERLILINEWLEKYHVTLSL